MHYCSTDLRSSCHCWPRSVFGRVTVVSSVESGQHFAAAVVALPCCLSCFPSWSAWQALESRRLVGVTSDRLESSAPPRTALCHCVSCRVFDMATMVLHEREPHMEICVGKKMLDFLVEIEFFTKYIGRGRKSYKLTSRALARLRFCFSPVVRQHCRIHR